MKSLGNAAGILSAVCILPLSSPALTEATSSLFSGSGNCAFCHEQWSGALLDSKGNDVSITGDWRATMMAHSFSDPLWQARMEAEVADHPELKDFIEDKCLTCHAPMARTQLRQDGGEALSMIQAREMALAHDGVSCTLCHQIRGENLNDESSLDGGYAIGSDRKIFGPYTNVVTMPMRNHVDYTPGFGAHVQKSAMCATCHTLFTPILDDEGKAEGEFPEQVPYLEWKNSIYPAQNRHCQDCHMPRLDEPILITARPPWIGTREPFWRHTFLGANTFMMQLLANAEDELCTKADEDAFASRIDRTRKFLREETAVLSVAPERNGDELLLRVKVENLAGHKFPTGYPYRRAWLRVEVQNETGETIFLSGAVDELGRLKGRFSGGYAPHHQEISTSDQVQVYEAVMGNADDESTTYLLRATHYLKDNRIPPMGFKVDGPHMEKIAVCGEAANDADYAEGLGCDRIVYRIAAPPSRQHLKIHVDLLYQPVPPESVELLLASDLDAAKAFSRLYRRTDKAPDVIQSVSLTLHASD